MSRDDIISEFPKLSDTDRRDIIRRVVEAEDDVQTLVEWEKLALERLRMLERVNEKD